LTKYIKLLVVHQVGFSLYENTNSVTLRQTSSFYWIHQSMIDLAPFHLKIPTYPVFEKQW